MKFFNFLIIFSLLFIGCQEEQFPVFDIPSSRIERFARNIVDENRLCLAQPLSKVLLNEEFREYLRLQSINSDENWNNEFIIIEHLNDVVFEGVTLKGLLKTVIDNNSDICIGRKTDRDA